MQGVMQTAKVLHLSETEINLLPISGFISSRDKFISKNL